ncbi:MAG: 4'-phosphopantetheinyl transferase superfamily protein [Desulfobacteraceae bacterium]|nr:MAG: 4'-phosphopantetheinyl transferase superfamily protein [Desulfobacteraceae bacterium]
MLNQDLWQKPPDRPDLGDQEVHIWQASLDIPQERIFALSRILSQDEIDRAERFHFAKDRNRFIAARGTLRNILGRYLNQPPETIAFTYNPYGKPSLPAAETTIRFNLSHAHQLALFAFSRAYEIGVDVEYINPQKDARDIVARFFSEDEKTEFRSLPADLLTRAFFSGWTRKEAFIKARGEGLSFPLEKFSVSLNPDLPARLIQVDEEKQDNRSWMIRQISVSAEYAAAVAVSSAATRFRYWDGAA